MSSITILPIIDRKGKRKACETDQPRPMPSNDKVDSSRRMGKAESDVLDQPKSSSISPIIDHKGKQKASVTHQPQPISAVVDHAKSQSSLAYRNHKCALEHISETKGEEEKSSRSLKCLHQVPTLVKMKDIEVISLSSGDHNDNDNVVPQSNNKCASYHSNLFKAGNTKAYNLNLWEQGESKVMACTTTFMQGMDRSNMMGHTGQDGRESHVFFITDAERVTSFHGEKTGWEQCIEELNNMVHGEECRQYSTILCMDGKILACTSEMESNNPFMLASQPIVSTSSRPELPPPSSFPNNPHTFALRAGHNNDTLMSHLAQTCWLNKYMPVLKNHCPVHFGRLTQLVSQDGHNYMEMKAIQMDKYIVISQIPDLSYSWMYGLILRLES
ncbi:hypothetical protein BD769DRAFT_1677794 [Suillus cothurnatus]|nr:hypothetical protein BD769DRAFT_1677794 [Suillus cothurnatus]